VFVDRAQIEVVAGNGGRGGMSFRREKYVPRGGPDGGDGGHGGSVILIAKPGVDSLAAVSHRQSWRAGHGQPGRPSDCHGRSAADLVIEVPPGTIVRDEATGLVLKDLAEAGEQVVVAEGGRGGRGNAHFKSSTNRAPRQFEMGGAGRVRRLSLELKVIADVGLVGLPNAGKSTLLARLSRARPEIADYAFTTKTPILGIVSLSPDRTFVLADLPGLIEGAHLGVGLGHEFLRHVERAGILVHIVEPMPVDESDPVENYHAIRSELVQYDASLGQRVEIIAVSKSELPGSEEVRARLEATIGRKVIAISGVTGHGLNTLLSQIGAALDSRAAAPPARGGP
jgi:GTP-binding protein